MADDYGYTAAGDLLLTSVPGVRGAKVGGFDLSPDDIQEVLDARLSTGDVPFFTVPQVARAAGAALIRAVSPDATEQDLASGRKAGRVVARMIGLAADKLLDATEADRPQREVVASAATEAGQGFKAEAKRLTSPERREDEARQRDSARPQRDAQRPSESRIPFRPAKKAKG